MRLFILSNIAGFVNIVLFAFHGIYTLVFVDNVRKNFMNLKNMYVV